MQRQTTRIISNKNIAAGIFDLTVEWRSAEIALPGQFVNIYLKNPAKLLPRPISICDFDGKQLRMIYRSTGAGSGTDELSGYGEGEEIDITAPVGRGYPIEEIKGQAVGGDIVLMGGGIGIPPMYYLAKKLGVGCTVVLGFRDEHTFLLNEFYGLGADVIIASDDGSIGVHGTVIDAITQSDKKPKVICACGPKPMLAAVKKYADKLGAAAYVSLEERMACGIGACLGCVTPTVDTDAHSRVKNARVCVDGPVFNADDVVL